MTIHTIHHSVKKLLWVSDLHLDKASPREKDRFLNHLTATTFDGLLITGDISVALYLERDLGEIAVACGSRPVIFILGNHDYFGSCFADVEASVIRVCSKNHNLVPLGHGEIIALSDKTAIIGHRGWYDGLAGSGSKTRIKCPDRFQIKDFMGYGHRDFFNKLESLGRESALYFRKILPVALKKYKNVLIGTHVPPFTQALQFDGFGCDWDRQPYFANRAAGNAIWGIAKKSYHRTITVYAGHSHSCLSLDMTDNLSIHVSAALHGDTHVGKPVLIR